MGYYKVGEIAEEAGVNVETLRYYEKIKIMPKPKRKESRYRIYDENSLKRLVFINRAKTLGFTLKEIKELLELRIESASTCGDVKRLADHKLKDVEMKIKDLNTIRQLLVKLINQCNSEQVSSDECPIIESIEHSD